MNFRDFFFMTGIGKAKQRDKRIIKGFL